VRRGRGRRGRGVGLDRGRPGRRCVPRRRVLFPRVLGCDFASVSRSLRFQSWKEASAVPAAGVGESCQLRLTSEFSVGLEEKNREILFGHKKNFTFLLATKKLIFSFHRQFYFVFFLATFVNFMTSGVKYEEK
jgi:hypothetical protein